MNTKDMAQSERELFEAAFPLPAGASYHKVHDKYLWDGTQRECLLVNEIRKTWQTARAPLLSRLAALEALSVTNIMIDVVPGDGSGLEVFAKSVGQIEDIISGLTIEVMELEARLEAAEKDAGRYRKLKLQNASDEMDVLKVYLDDSAAGTLVPVPSNELDFSIDAARRGNE